MQTAIANELRARKAKLQKDIAALSSVRAARAPRSDKGSTRDKRVVTVVSRREPVGPADLETRLESVGSAPRNPCDEKTDHV